MNSKWALKNEGQDSQITIFARARLKDELSFDAEKKAKPYGKLRFASKKATFRGIFGGFCSSIWSII